MNQPNLVTIRCRRCLGEISHVEPGAIVGCVICRLYTRAPHAQTKARKPKGHFARLSVADYRKLAPENGRGGIRPAVCELLKLRGIPHSITDGALIFDESGELAGRAVLTDGWPDITGCLPGGRLLAIETKSQNGRLRPAQVTCLGSLRAMGALVIVARSVDDVAAQLDVRHLGVSTARCG